MVGLVFRWVATYFATAQPQFTVKERAFLAFAWMPKATVQAAIGGIVLDTASSIQGISEENRTLYKTYGN